MGELGVRIAAVVITGVDVDRDVGQLRDGVEHGVAGLLSDLVGRGERLVAVGGDPGFAVDGVTDPARPDRVDRLDARERLGRRLQRDRAGAGSIASISRCQICTTAFFSTKRIATVIARPTSGSA